MAGPRRPLERVVRRLPRVQSQRIAVAPERPLRKWRPSSWSLLIAFPIIVAIGTVLLMVPAASEQPGPAPLLTALFTATSATFVTGLTVVDTATYWTPLGQGTILALIQLGGLGYMTGMAAILLAAGQRVTLSQRQVLRLSLGGGVLGRVDIEAAQIVLATLVIEGLGFAVLFARFALAYDPSTAGWWALFHSVSAFNNAGFDITGGPPSLFEFRQDPFVVLPITILSLVGALGIGAVGALAVTRGWRRLHLDAKLVLITSAILIVTGMAGILLSEWENPASMGGAPAWVKLMDGFALSVSSRTAGFSTFTVASMTEYTLFLLVGLMFIGGAAGSVAGGIKVNTFSVLLATVWSSVRGKPNTEVFGREVAEAQIRQALAVTLIAVLWVQVATLLLSLLETGNLIDLLFEAVSAFGLAGLSTGLTPSLTAAGQVILIATMTFGRLAPLLLALEMTRRETTPQFRYAREDIRIG